MKIIKLLFICVSLLFSSCEKELISDDYILDPNDNFNYLWNDFDARYAFFELKNIDWNSYYDSFKQFLAPKIPQDSLFSVLDAMLYNLKDGHVNIVAPFNRSRNWAWFEDYPENFNESLVYRNYLKQKFQIIGPFDCVQIDSILYVYYASFAAGFSDKNLEALVSLAKNCKGLILDIRNNTGGSSSNAFKLPSLFADKSYKVGRRRIKISKKEYSSWEDIEVKPFNLGLIQIPVVLLTNRKTYSAANNFTLMMKSLPSVIHLGDKTGGGGGTPVFNQMPNGWVYRFSATQTQDMSNNLIESGLEPDRYVATSLADELKGEDTIIEEALDELR